MSDLNKYKGFLASLVALRESLFRVEAEVAGHFESEHPINEGVALMAEVLDTITGDVMEAMAASGGVSPVKERDVTP